MTFQVLEPKAPKVPKVNEHVPPRAAAQLDQSLGTLEQTVLSL